MPKTPERCQEIRKEMRMKILHDSMLYFARNGFAGTKISDLAKQIGIAQGTIYLYFKSKEDLFNEIFSLISSKKDIKELKLLSLAPVPAKHKIKTLSNSIMERLAQDDSYAAKIALNTQVLFEKNEFASEDTTYQSDLYKYTAKIIEQGQKDGYVVDGSPMKLADFYWGVVYLYALKKLFTTKYEMICADDLARTLLKDNSRRNDLYGKEDCHFNRCCTGGIGREFIKILAKEPLDEIWVVGRNAERLNFLKEQFGEKIIPLCKDLANAQELDSIHTLLIEARPIISYLINNAGIARMAKSTEFSSDEIRQTIELNCTTPSILINSCIPYMRKGSRILNVSSASAFQPVPYINLYAATKAFERNYSRALNIELKPIGITVTAVCPSWVDTQMLSKEINGKKVNFPGMVSPERVAEKAIRDAKKGKDMSVCSFYVKCQHLNVKLMPQKLTMKIWLHGVKKYL